MQKLLLAIITMMLTMGSVFAQEGDEARILKYLKIKNSCLYSHDSTRVKHTIKLDRAEVAQEYLDGTFFGKNVQGDLFVLKNDANNSYITATFYLCKGRNGSARSIGKIRDINVSDNGSCINTVSHAKVEVEFMGHIDEKMFFGANMIMHSIAGNRIIAPDYSVCQDLEE
jgi:hypothetical protein